MAKETLIEVDGKAARVVSEGGHFSVQGYETEDEDIVSYFSGLEADEALARFETALKVGVISIRTIGLTERIDYVQKEFNLLNSKFDSTIQNTLQSLDQKFEEIFGEKGKGIEVFEDHFGEDGRVVKEVFDPMREGSPLYELRIELRNEMQRLRTEMGISQAVEDIKKKTPLKGYDFEDFCEGALSKAARQVGDVLYGCDRAGKVKLSRKETSSYQ